MGLYLADIYRMLGLHNLPSINCKPYLHADDLPWLCACEALAHDLNSFLWKLRLLSFLLRVLHTPCGMLPLSSEFF